MIRDATQADAAAIAAIYNPFVKDSAVTFEVDEVPEEEIARRIHERRTGGLPFIVWEEDGQVAAYAYASPYGTREAFARTVELSTYLDPAFNGRGIGTRIYQDLIERCRELGMHLLVGRVALPNPASQSLHAKCGFELAGVLPQAGYKFGRFHDLAYYTRLLD